MSVRFENTFRCSKTWNELSGNGNIRHCGDCNKNVIDFTNLSDDEVQLILQQGAACGMIQSRRTVSNFLLSAALGAGLISSIAASAQENRKPQPVIKIERTVTNSVFGRVLDKGTGEGIPFCQVALKQNNKQLFVAQTDLSGDYSIKLDTVLMDISESYTLIAHAVGYDKESVEVKVNRRKNREGKNEVGFKKIDIECDGVRLLGDLHIIIDEEYIINKKGSNNTKFDRQTIQKFPF